VQEKYFDNGIELFHRIVIESGEIKPKTTKTAETESTNLLVKYLMKNGLAETEEKALEIISYLPNPVIEYWFRYQSMEELTSFTHRIPSTFTDLIGQTLGIADGYVMDDWLDIYGSLKEGKLDGTKVPAIIGCNNDEGKLFFGHILSPTLNFEEYDTDHLPEELILKMIYEVFSTYCYCEIPEPLKSWIDYFILHYTDMDCVYELMSIACTALFEFPGVNIPASLMSLHNDDIFVYRFNWDQEPNQLNTFLGACHSLELPFIFGNMDWGTDDVGMNVAWSEENEQGRIKLSDAMISYWKNFIHNGDPGDPDGWSLFYKTLPRWDDFDDLRGSERIIFDANNYKTDIYMELD